MVDGRGEPFIEALEREGIAFEENKFRLTSAQFDMAEIFSGEIVEMLQGDTLADVLMIPLSDYHQLDPDVMLSEGRQLLQAITGSRQIYCR